MSGSLKSQVKVYARVRPSSNFSCDSIQFVDGQTINIHNNKDVQQRVVDNQVLDWSFKVDGILHNTTQEQVYKAVAHDMTIKALEGYNGTLMSYGQTGAGKTFTVTGATENYKQRGLIPRTIAQIFQYIQEQSDKSIAIKISYLEIYNETMFDLLSTLPESIGLPLGESMTIVESKDGSVRVKGLSLHAAINEGEALNLLFEGETNRAIASHSLNQNSSRSHCIFTIHIESQSQTESKAKFVSSKLNLVDLAGSERIFKTGSTGQLQKEAMYINKSLTFLEQTVIALAEKNRGHIPYRQTKLTHVLQDSIGGRCNTTLIANVYGDALHIEETISTLRFAMRMMCVPVEATVNNHYDPWMLVHELEEEIKHLKQELDMHNTLANRNQVKYGLLSEGQVNDIRKQVKMFLEGKSSEIDVSNLRHITTVFSQFRNLLVEMKNDVNEQYKRKFVLLDKNDSEIMLTLQKAGLPLDEEGNFMGVNDTGISVPPGPMINNVVVNPSSVKTKPGSVASPKRRSGKKSRAGGSPTSRAPASPSPPVHGDLCAKTAKSGVVHGTVVSVDAEAPKDGSISAESSAEERKPTSRSCTPPSRNNAFEEFKKKEGQEIHRILTENKTVLFSKKQNVREMAHAVNATKRMIDGCRIALDRKKKDRTEQGEFVNEVGDTVIDEEEFQLIIQMKTLKQTYRHDYDELCNFKSEVEYCQRLVDQCRQRLIQEFDIWYSDSFLHDPPETNLQVGFGRRPGTNIPRRLQLKAQQLNIEDDQEKFERMQQDLLMDHHGSAVFYNAKMRTQNRQMYDKNIGRTPASSIPTDIGQMNVRSKTLQNYMF